MKIAVLGSSGGMGGFFVRYFLDRGYSVAGYDRRKNGVRHPRLAIAASNADAAKGADVVLIATPLEKTVETFAEASRGVAPGTLVVEITSVKGKTLRELRERVRSVGARLLSLHPLFGPSLKSGEMKLCVIRTESTSIRTARALFPGATIIPMKAAEHDRAMGLILGLTHLMNIAYAGAVSAYLTPGEFRRLETPTSSVQLTLAEGVLSQDPALYSRIQLDNIHSVRFARALIRELERLTRMVERGDRKGFERRFSELANVYAGDSASAMERVYQAFDKPPKAVR